MPLIIITDLSVPLEPLYAIRIDSKKSIGVIIKNGNLLLYLGQSFRCNSSFS